MGIYDRDYMREPNRKKEPAKPRPHIKKAGNKPSLWERLRFWLWSLSNGK